MSKILVTGVAGFIGFHLSRYLLDRGDEVIGIDNLNDYYDVQLKKSRLSILEEDKNFSFKRIDISNQSAVEKLFTTHEFDRVANLAAQAGVRYSLENPHSYINSNIAGFLNILEGCRHNNINHLVFASSSSVYGGNTSMPFSVHNAVDHPLSLYAASKKSNELMAHTYAHLYGLPATGLRFFTVYGPWGRPDMALFLFTKAILKGEPIKVFNHGVHKRDFTYVADIVDGIVRVLDRPAKPNPNWDSNKPDPSSSTAPYRIYNIGNGSPVGLSRFIEVIEENLGKKAEKILLPMQAGDVPETFADITSLTADTGYNPKVTVDEGIANFISWYREYYSA